MFASLWQIPSLENKFKKHNFDTMESFAITTFAKSNYLMTLFFGLWWLFSILHADTNRIIYDNNINYRLPNLKTLFEQIPLAESISVHQFYMKYCGSYPNNSMSKWCIEIDSTNGICSKNVCNLMLWSETMRFVSACRKPNNHHNPKNDVVKLIDSAKVVIERIPKYQNNVFWHLFSREGICHKDAWMHKKYKK